MNYILLDQLTQQFAAAQTNQSYNCGAYGEGGYNRNDNCVTTTDGSSKLPDTGMNVVIGITGGVLLVVAAIVILATMRRKRSKK
jgi:LPXTG-motif cell wall-anchored protein